MIIIEKSIHHLFHPFTSYDNNNDKLSFIQGVAALAVGYYATSLAAAGRLSPRVSYYYPYLTGITVFYLFTAILKTVMPKSQLPPVAQHGPPPTANVQPPIQQKPIIAPSPPPPKNVLMDWKVTLGELMDYYNSLTETSTICVQEFEDIQNEELGKRLQKLVKEELDTKRNVRIPTRTKIRNIMIKVKQDSELNNKLIEIISKYHPYTSTPEEFIEHCATDDKQSCKLKMNGMIVALILCGFLKTNKPLKDVPNIKGCVNSETYFTKKPVDFIPTTQFAILQEDDFGLEESELDQFENHGTYIELKKLFDDFDKYVVKKTYTLEKCRSSYKTIKELRIETIKSLDEQDEQLKSMGAQQLIKPPTSPGLQKPLPQYLRNKQLSKEEKKYAIII